MSLRDDAAVLVAGACGASIWAVTCCARFAELTVGAGWTVAGLVAKCLAAALSIVLTADVAKLVPTSLAV